MSVIAYTRYGAGQPLLLVHGIGHQRSAWGETANILAREFDVIAVDLPGFGSSPAPVPPHGYSIPSYADQLMRLCRELGVTNPHVAGNSLGGAIGLEMGRRSDAASVTAISPAGFWDNRPNPAAIVRLLALKGMSYAPSSVTRRSVEHPRLRQMALGSLYYRADHLSVDVAMAEADNLRNSPGFFGVARANADWNFTGPVTCPVTIAWGDKDRILPYRQALKAGTMLPHAAVVTLWGCGHVPMADDPEMVADAIRETIQRQH